MITNIEIDYPDLGVHINESFKPGINLIEQPNGWGKTTMINTIHSLFTGKMPGMKTLPQGTAVIQGTHKGLMNRNKWVGSPPPNPLYEYIIPGRFFQLSTVEQREVFTNLLKIDINGFMSGLIPGWHPEMESELKKKRPDYLSKEEILLSDIMELQSFFINNQPQDFSDVESFIAQRNLVYSKVEEHNKDIGVNIREYNDLKMSIKSIETYETPIVLNEIKSIEKEIESFNTSCPTCKTELPKEQIDLLIQNKTIELNKYKEQLNALTNTLITLKNKLDTTIEPFYLDINDLENNANKFLIQLPPITIERHSEYNQYLENKSLIESKQQELQKKQDLLKTFDTIGIDKTLEDINQAKNKFVTYLESIVKVLPFNIELFELFKNGNIKPSFKIKKDGIEYKQLSTGNKAMIEIMIAKLFIDNLGLDFILIDEAAHISKSNLDYIKQLSLTYQVILCKPTGWDLTDFN